MFPCRGRQNDAKGTKIKTRCTLGAAAWLPPFCSSPPLEALIFIYAHNACQLLCLAHAAAFGFSLVMFLQQKWIKSLAALCTSAEEHTSQGTFEKAARRPAYLGLPDVPKKSDCKRLSESEEWRNSFVVLKNWEYRSIVSRIALKPRHISLLCVRCSSWLNQG